MIHPATAHRLAPTWLYERLPRTVQRRVRDAYYRVAYGGTEAEILRSFVDTVFESADQYERLTEEFYDLGGAATIERARERHARVTDGAEMAEIAIETVSKYYALVRAVRPDAVVETGVCNGVSTYGLLLALHENDHGHLTSVDYPVHEGEAAANHAPGADHVGLAIVPDDHEPGWVVPEALHDRWTLRLGLSQVELPRLRADVDEIDLFVHDSGHSLPCMMFEFELAWNWLGPGGLLLTDDVLWDGHRAFDLFAEARCEDGTWGYAGPNTGYAVR